MLTFNTTLEELTTQLSRPFRRIWHHFTHLFLLRRRVQISCLSDSTLYTALRFSKPDIDALHQKLQGSLPRCDWYGDIDTAVTISYDISVKTLDGSQRPSSEEYPVVFPCRPCSNGVVAVRKELMQAVNDLRSAIEGDLFGRRRSDQENPACFPIVLAVPRFSDLSEDRMRRIGVGEWLEAVLRAIKAQSQNSESCWLVLKRIDFEQCGIYCLAAQEEMRFPVGDIESPNDFIRIKLSLEKLKAYVNDISGINSLVCDVLILLNDRRSPNRDNKINLRRVATHVKCTSTNKSMDEEKIKLAIEQVYVKDENSLNKGKQSIRSKGIEHDVDYVLDISRNGYGLEFPVKGVHGSVCAFHLFRDRKGTFLYFNRSVKSVSQVGYRIRRCSTWLWILLTVGAIVPIVYVLWRSLQRSGVSVEDLVQTAIALVGVITAVFSPFVFQICYRGERLADILSNVRNVDTQEEFKGRKSVKQLIDVMEIIRKADTVPQFLGGRKMGYVWQQPPRTENRLSALSTMPFPNLELVGFALYEDAEGEMYMFDKWENLFEVKIQILLSNKPEESSSSHWEKRPETNPYELTAVDSDPTMTLHCSPVFFSRTNISTAAIPIPTRGCLDVSYKTTDGRDAQKIITRLLPFCTRKRCVIRKGWRSHDSTKSWEKVNNADILKMDTGE